MTTGSVSLRAVTATDRDHLFRVYASTREEELSMFPFTPEQKETFLEMQFTARERDYAARFSTKDHVVVEHEGTPAGYLWVHRSDDELRILDIALLPEHRGVGIGTRLLSSLVDEARQRCIPIRLHVLVNSAARGLYERLGFTAVGEASVYQRMEILP